MTMGVDGELVSSQLKNAGLYGAIISVLLSTIGGLILYIRSLHKKADKVYGYRLQERDALNKALSDSTSAILAQTEASKERNRLTEELAKAIDESTAQAGTLQALLKLQFDFLKEDHLRQGMVISAMSESVRNLASSASTIQMGVSSLPQLFQNLQSHIDAITTERGNR